MGLVNASYLVKYSGELRWVDDAGSVVKTTTLSDVNVHSIRWSQNGDYFYTASSASIEKWARNGTAYIWKNATITSTLHFLGVDSSDNLYVLKADDFYILGESDGVADYTNSNSDLSGYIPYGMIVDPSTGNAYVFAQEGSYTDIKVFVFDNTLTLTGTVTLYTGYYVLQYNAFARDSSGNYFVSAANYLRKYNSSGTEIWTYSPDSGSSLIKDIVIANSGKIYATCFGSGTYICRLTDNGASVSEDYAVNYASTGIYRIAVSSDIIFGFSASTYYDNTAFNESDGTSFSGFVDVDVNNEVLFGGLDPLWSLTANHFELTESINYDRWVLVGGNVDVGHLEIECQNTIKSYGNKLIDRVLLKCGYGENPTTETNYGYVVMAGDPPCDSHYYIPYAYQTAVANGLIDKDGNSYVMCYRPYTSEEASAKSGGFYTTATDYQSIHKIDKNGVFQWESNIIIGGISQMRFDLNDDYIITGNGLTAVGQYQFRKWAVTTGVEYNGDSWPMDIIDDINDVIEAWNIGRDGYLYFVVLDDTAGSYGLPYLYKYDLNGDAVSGWTPLLIEQMDSDPYYVTHAQYIDVTSDGYIAIGLLTKGGSTLSGDFSIIVYNPNQTERYKTYLVVENVYGCSEIFIEESSYDVIATEHYGLSRWPDGVNYPFSGTYDWLVTHNGSTGELAGSNQMHNRQVMDAIYTYSYFVGETYCVFKTDISDGSLMWALLEAPETKRLNAAVGTKPVAAWAIEVTVGSNGTARTGSIEKGIGAVEVSNGTTCYAEQFQNYTLEFYGDTGYYVDTVTVDGVNVGFPNYYTFENVNEPHTISITFGTGYHAGHFEETLVVRGGVGQTFVIGPFSETYQLSLSKINFAFIGGPLSETLTLRSAGVDMALAFLILINNERALNSLPPVLKNDMLYVAAERHSLDMATNEFLSHTGSDSSTYAERIEDAGYHPEYATELVMSGDVAITAQDYFDSLMGNPAAEAEILNVNYDEIGIGVDYNNGKNYICIVMAKFAWWWTIVDIGHFELNSTLNNNFSKYTFMTPELYTDFLEQTDSDIHSMKYKAIIGDYEIPNLISFNYRLEIDIPSKLTLTTLFTHDVWSEIKSRIDDEISIKSVSNYKGEEYVSSVVDVTFTEFEIIPGESRKITISGYKTVNHYNSYAELKRVTTRIKDKDGKIRYRCAHIDFYLRPTCIAKYGSEEITIGKVVIFVNNGVTQYMEVTEA